MYKCSRIFLFLRYNSWFSWLLRRVVWWLDTNVSDDRAASIFRAD